MLFWDRHGAACTAPYRRHPVRPAKNGTGAGTCNAELQRGHVSGVAVAVLLPVLEFDDEVTFDMRTNRQRGDRYIHPFKMQS